MVFWFYTQQDVREYTRMRDYKVYSHIWLIFVVIFYAHEATNTFIKERWQVDIL